MSINLTLLRQAKLPTRFITTKKIGYNFLLHISLTTKYNNNKKKSTELTLQLSYLQGVEETAGRQTKEEGRGGRDGHDGGCTGWFPLMCVCV